LRATLRLVREVVGTAQKAAVSRPIWVKLSPLVTDIGLIARATEEAGADAPTVANTYPAMAVDFTTRRSMWGNTAGDLSGRAIKPITLAARLGGRKAVKIPIIGLGGIETAGDVLQYTTVGASAVQVGTASFSGRRASEGVVEALESTENLANIFTFR
jgi:dihydroorotate dehydrogenase (NAD+) catalytic subunit